MNVTAIGIDAKAGPILEDVAAELAFFQECGFKLVELSVHDLDVVLNGRLHQQRLRDLVALARSFPFEYTVHDPDRTNLACSSDPELERDVLAASLEVCAAVGARVLVYHSGLSAFHWLRLPAAEWPSEAQMNAAWEAETRGLQDLMPLAARHGVVICVENMNYTGYEVEQLRKVGQPVSELRTYFPDLFLSELVEQVQSVHHPNLGITLDVGHLFTVTRPLGLDYLGTIQEAAPYVRHIHISDNFGRPQGPYHSPREWNTHGEGDVHLPPGWGDIPLADIFSALSGYSGAVVLELRDRYRPYYRESKERIAALVYHVKGE